MNDSNSLVAVFIIGSLLVTLLSFYIALFVIIQKNKNRRHLAEKKEMEHAFQNEMLQTKLELQEAALSMVSREIHDNVGQLLGTVMNNLISLNKGLSEGEQKEIVESSKKVLAKASKDLRNISHTLNSEYIDNVGLEGALQQELDHIQSNHAIQIELKADGDPDGIFGEKALMIFRIAQETLQNIIKHARATKINISLLYQSGEFNLSISDDGRVISENAGITSGLELLNMKQRAKLMNGTIAFLPNHPTGTTVSLKIPL